MKKVTIMLATYNGEKFIKEQLDSIVSQTYTNWELLISDDYSKDNTFNILKKYQREYSDKIFLTKNDEQIHSAKGNFINLFNHVNNSDYYMFCDQDDVWENNKIEILINQISNYDDTKPILMYSDLKIVDKNLNTINDSFMKFTKNYFPKDDFKNFLLENHIPGCVMFFNKALKKKITYIPECCRMHDWWVALCASTYGKIIFIDQPLNLYRQHEKNTIGAKKRKIHISIKSFINRIKTVKKYNISILKQLNELKKIPGLNDDKKKLLCDTIRLLKSNNYIHKFLKLKKYNYEFADKKNLYRYSFINIGKGE